MIEQRARVVCIEGDDALVQASASAGCGACALRQGCAASKIGQLLRQRPALWRVPNSLAARAGQEVTLGIDDDALLASAAIAYLPPLLGLLAGAVIAAAAASGNLWPALGAACGFALGCALSHRLAGIQARRCAPRVLVLPARAADQASIEGGNAK